ncbi:MAG TPA: DMT family transporter [Acidobacteriota bacterium]|nr:DMT family transporter [Acidobacteriota bacterium]
MARRLNGSRIGRTDLLILLVIVLWSVNLSVIKIGLRSLSPHGFNAIRLGLAAIAYAAVLIARPGAGRLAKKGDGWKAAGLGLLGITFYQVFFIKAVSIMDASTASIVMGTSPIFIALLATAVGEERIPVAGWAGIVISFAGFLLVVTGENGGLAFTWEAWRGAILILLANACWAGYTVFSKPVLDRNPAFRLAAVGTIAGTAVYLPFAVRDLAGVEWARISWQAWGAILYSGLVAIFLCFVIWYASVKEVGSAKTGVYSNLTPILAIFFAGLVLGERLSALQAVGAAITLAGVYLTRSGYRFFERKVEAQTEADTSGRPL